jgi:hypothetical protein
MILVASAFLAAAFLTLSPAQAETATASANISPASSGHGRGAGVGAVTMLNGTSGALFTYGSSGGGFHVDGLFGLHHYRPGGPGATNNVTDFSIGGRFWYHLHAASFADFSLGGGLGIISRSTGVPGAKSNTDVSLEVGGQIRTFIVPNVALLADLGLGVYFGANDDLLIGGQNVGGGNFVQGTLGIAYFFE